MERGSKGMQEIHGGGGGRGGGGKINSRSSSQTNDLQSLKNKAMLNNYIKS